MKLFKQFLLGIILIFTLLITFLGLQRLEDSERSKEKEEKIANQVIQNEDVKAWLRVEGTQIDYPVVQHPSDDSYYLSHDTNHQETYYGAIFIESINALDFNDVVTIVYGHAIQDGSMFGSLAYFSDATFFDSFKRVEVVRNGETLVYDIIAAYPYTDVHLYHTFRLDSPDFVKAYVADIERKAQEFGGLYRHHSFDETKDKLLILSTCDARDDNQRFVVHAIRKGQRS